MISKPLTAAIKAYQRTKGFFFIDSCRFHPSCSHYTVEAIEKYGAVRGLAKGMWRLMRCSPLSAGGHDPVR